VSSTRCAVISCSNRPVRNFYWFPGKAYSRERICLWVRSRDILVAGLLGRLINHLTEQHTFVLMPLGHAHLTETCISSPCIRESVPLQQMKTPMRQFYTTLGQNKFAT
jgi:hypothetical protein